MAVASSISTLIPARRWIASYRRAYLRNDLVAGLTTAAVVIPQAMAYATIAGLPLEAGLYCGLLPMAIYAFLGTSRPLSVSTTSTISLLTGEAISSSGGSDVTSTAVTLAALVGVFLLGAGILRLGFLADFISPHVLLGFKMGTGLLIIADQLGKILGIEESGSNFFQKIASVVENLGQTSLATLALGGASIFVLVVLHRFAPQLPGPLIVLILGIVVVGVFSLGSEGVALTGGVPTGLPSLSIPDLSIAPGLAGAAAGIALMAFVESIGAGRTFRKFEDPPLDSNQELRALGIAGLAGSLTQAYPVGGGLSQTAVNNSARAATQAAGLVTSVIVLATLLFLAPLFDNLAAATLGALVLVAAAGLVDVRALTDLGRIGFRHWIGAALTLLVVLLFGTLDGVLVGVVFSLILTLHLLNQPVIETLVLDTSRSEVVVADVRGAWASPGKAVLRLIHPVYYANWRRTADAIESWHREFEPRPHKVIVDMPAQSDVGPGFVDFLREVHRMTSAGGSTLVISGITESATRELGRIPAWSELEHSVEVSPTVQAALDTNRQ